MRTASSLGSSAAVFTIGRGHEDAGDGDRGSVVGRRGPREVAQVGREGTAGGGDAAGGAELAREARDKSGLIHLGGDDLTTTRQARTEDRVFLLGAGAARDAGVPLARELTGTMLQSVPSEAASYQQSLALNFVVSALMAERGRHGRSPLEYPDIETVASAIALLADRDNVELTPFVQSWDPGVGAVGLSRTHHSS